FLIRHGESANNIANDLNVPWDRDPPLTDRGRGQIQALGRRLVAEGMRFDRVYSSSLQRSVHSARELLLAMGVNEPKFESVDALDEIRVAVREGRPFDQKLSPDERDHFTGAGVWWVYGPEASRSAESERLVERRIIGFIEDRLLHDSVISSQAGVKRVALVSHGHAIRSALHGILGFDSRYVRRIQIDNASVSRMRFTVRGWYPVSINDAWHTHDVGDVQREAQHHPMDGL
ncbi:MAG: histidine phosphatase family protein, partial [Chloroflexi bacterium]|nr:histidine phosphatase family protein [Chloroflexota bacterium]